MGTIVIYELARAGSGKQTDTQVAKLDNTLVRTADATTSTTAESVTLGKETKIIGFVAVENHRVSIGTNNTADNGNYIDISADTTGIINWFGVDGGETLYYRLDA